jgi:hypothetical protein
LPESRLGAEVTPEVVDPSTGDLVPSLIEQQEHAAHRPRGRYLSFVAHDIPPLGYSVYELRPGHPIPGRTETHTGREPRIENEHYQVEYDPDGGCIAHIYDRASGEDLVSSNAPFGFNQYIYDRYGTAPHFNHLSSRIEAVDLSLLGSRSLGGHGVVTARSSTAVWDRVTVRVSGEGVYWLETVLTLVCGVKRLDITNRLHKIGTPSKESAFFAFPFNVAEPEVAYEITGGTGSPSGPRVPGSANHMRAIRHWVTLKTPNTVIGWATLEAPLIQLGNLHLPYSPFPATLERDDAGTIYSWVMNNIWDTNFPSSQQGEMEFRYAVATDRSERGTELARETAAALTTPLLAVPANPSEALSLPARGSFCTISRSDVEVVALTRSRRRHDLVVWLQAHVTSPTNVALSFPMLQIGRAWKGTHLERNLEEVPVEGSEVRLRVRPGELATLSLRARAMTDS